MTPRAELETHTLSSFKFQFPAMASPANNKLILCAGNLCTCSSDRGHVLCSEAFVLDLANATSASRIAARLCSS